MIGFRLLCVIAVLLGLSGCRLDLLAARFCDGDIDCLNGQTCSAEGICVNIDDGGQSHGGTNVVTADAGVVDIGDGDGDYDSLGPLSECRSKRRLLNCFLTAISIFCR